MVVDPRLPGRDVSRETLARLEEYEEILKKWNSRINLVAKSTIGSFWSRHASDSAQIWSLARQKGKWSDLGSGAGFPGLVVAILAVESGGLNMTLVESDHRKATFLRTCANSLGVPVTVISQRVEDIDPMVSNTISARALAPLPALLGLVQGHIAPLGECLFLKGKNYTAELKEAQKLWQFSCEVITSETDQNGVVLRIGDISRV